jgi:hypothetical protein
MKTFASSSDFSIWHYFTSDNYLIIHSGYNLHHPHGWSVDLIFGDVFYTELPFVFNGLEINTPTVDDLQHLAGRCKEPSAEANYYVLLTGGKRYYIGAAYMRIEHNNLDAVNTPFDLAQEARAAERKVRTYTRYSDLAGTFSNPRTFRLWNMVVSHRVILIRSERDYNNPESENIDLILEATTYIELPAVLDGLKIITPNAVEQEYLEGRVNRKRDYDSYFVLISEERRYYITTADILISYNQLGPKQNSYGCSVTSENT